MKHVSKSVFGFLFFAFFATASHAYLISGSIDSGTDGGMTATSLWDNGNATLDWGIDFDSNTNLWTYTYDFVVGAKDLSHIIFETSDNFTEDNIFAGTTSGWDLDNFGDEGNSNPGILDTIYGLKFGGDGLDNTFTIVTDRIPMWGSFYAKDGKNDGDDVYAYNDLFGETSSASIYGAAPDGLILVPDTVTTKVPEPMPLSLLVAGVTGMWLTKRKRGSKAKGG